MDTPTHDDSRQLLLNADAWDQRRYDRSKRLRSAGYAVVGVASASEAIKTVVHRDVALAILEGEFSECELTALGETLQRMRPTMGVVTVSTACDRQGRSPNDQFSVTDDRETELLTVVATALREGPRLADDPDPEFVTDVWGRIQGASDKGAQLLNGTRRGLLQRNLLTFFDAKRDLWHDAARRASAGERVQLVGRVRPKERRPVPVSVRITRGVGVSGAILEWSIDHDASREITPEMRGSR